jgi:MSHA biogenesis protein MshK
MRRARLFGCCLLVAATGAWAQNLPDPTRPPEGFDRGTPSAEAASGPMLQSTLISGSRREAIINGETLRVGDKFRNAEVAEIREGEVVLKEGKEKQTLRLFPEVQRRNTAKREEPKAERAPGKKGRQEK